MRRCFFIATSWRDRAVPKHFKALAQRLADRGHQAVVFIDGKKKEMEVPQGNPAVLSWPSVRPTTLKDARFLWETIRQYRPDALVANFGAVNLFSMVGWMTGVTGRIVWERTLSAQHDIDNEKAEWVRSFRQFRRRLVYAAATHVVANSEATLADVTGHYRVPASKCLVFHNALPDPLDKYPSLVGEEKVENRVVCVGRHDYSKGQDVLLHAIAEVRKVIPDVELVLVGDGDFRPTLEALAAELAIADNCQFVGGVEHEAVFHHMAKASVTVVPSRSEAFGWVNAESMAVCTPVIGAAVGGIPEIIREGVDGYLVPPDDAATLAERLIRLLQDKKSRARMGQQARQRFLDHFEQSHMLDRQVQWLETLTESPVA